MREEQQHQQQQQSHTNQTHLNGTSCVSHRFHSFFFLSISRWFATLLFFFPLVFGFPWRIVQKCSLIIYNHFQTGTNQQRSTTKKMRSTNNFRLEILFRRAREIDLRERKKNGANKLWLRLIVMCAKVAILFLRYFDWYSALFYRLRGKFYLLTNSEPPFGKNN